MASSRSDQALGRNRYRRTSHFSENDGEALGVIGPNGSAKTTVFNILSGITKADQGEVFFQGTDITHLRAFERCRRGIARSFQVPRPFAGMSVFENLLVGAAFGDGKPERSVYNQCVQVLEETGSLPPADIEQKTIEQDGLAVKLDYCPAN